MNNNVNFDGYGYPDMSILNNMFMSENNTNLNNSQDMNLSNIKTNQNLAQPYEGYIRGNLFNNLYQEYKNYRPAKLIPNNEQAELLLNVSQTTFAAHEIKLYLDIHPDDTNMIHLYNEYQKQASDAIKSYERKFGPILADSPSATNTFSWQAYTWPWEREEM